MWKFAAKNVKFYGYIANGDRLLRGLLKKNKLRRTLSGETIYFNRIDITFKYCGEISDWETQLIKALKETEKYQVDAGRLLLLKGNEVVASWR